MQYVKKKYHIFIQIRKRQRVMNQICVLSTALYVCTYMDANHITFNQDLGTKKLKLQSFAHQNSAIHSSLLPFLYLNFYVTKGSVVIQLESPELSLLKWGSFNLHFSFFCVLTWLDSSIIFSVQITPGASLVAPLVKNLPALWDTWAPSLGWKDSLEEGMATLQYSCLANPHGQRNLTRYNPGGHKVKHD